MPIFKGVTQLRGEFGNPDGSGLAKLVVDNLDLADADTAEAAMQTFAAALKTGNFTQANVGKTNVTQSDNLSAVKAIGVDVDDQLVVTYEKSGTKGVRTITVSGCDQDSVVLEAKDAGRRLTSAAATALEVLLNALHGWESLARVKVGKFISKR